MSAKLRHRFHGPLAAVGRTPIWLSDFCGLSEINLSVSGAGLIFVSTIYALDGPTSPHHLPVDIALEAKFGSDFLQVDAPQWRMRVYRHILLNCPSKRAAKSFRSLARNQSQICTHRQKEAPITAMR